MVRGVHWGINCGNFFSSGTHLVHLFTAFYLAVSSSCWVPLHVLSRSQPPKRPWTNWKVLFMWQRFSFTLELILDHGSNLRKKSSCTGSCDNLPLNVNETCHTNVILAILHYLLKTLRYSPSDWHGANRACEMETVINISAALLLLLSSAPWYIVHAAALITGYCS